MHVRFPFYTGSGLLTQLKYSLVLLFVLLFDLVMFGQSLQFAGILQFDETSFAHKGSVLIQELNPFMRVVRQRRVLVLFRPQAHVAGHENRQAEA